MLRTRLKLMVLHELRKEDLSGYSIMKVLEKLIGKKPSPGYIYPLLHDLKKANLVSVKKSQRKKVYSINGNGKKFLADLKKKHRQSMDAMIKAFEPLGERIETDKFYNFHTKILAFKERISQDMDVFSKFIDSLFVIYQKDDPKKRKLLRSIIRKTAKQLEKLK
jgi:DNA-binding PadR family transcriptional regulator